MLTKSALHALRLFNEKAAKLLSFSFINKMQGSGLTISSKIGEPVSADVRGPDQEATDAFILTLRFFIQDNERSSFSNLEKLYESLDCFEPEKKAFKEARKTFNSYLDARTELQFNFNGKWITNREVFDTFIYGELAHSQQSERYNQWARDPITVSIVKNEFNMILAETLCFIGYVKELNEAVLAQEQVESEKKG